jgi:hypothetical protein
MGNRDNQSPDCVSEVIPNKVVQSIPAYLTVFKDSDCNDQLELLEDQRKRLLDKLRRLIAGQAVEEAGGTDEDNEESHNAFISVWYETRRIEEA